MTKKRIIAIISAAAVMMCLSACGDTDITEDVTAPTAEETDYIDDIVTVTEVIAEETSSVIATAAENEIVTSVSTSETTVAAEEPAAVTEQALQVTTAYALYEYEVPDGQEIDEWGITMSVKDVTSVRCTVVFTQSGGYASGDLESGTYYALERYENGKWTAVEELPSELPMPWAALSLPITKNDTTEYGDNWHNWETRYGELPAGQYRIIKEVTMEADYPEETPRRAYRAEFEILEESGDTVSGKLGITMSVKDVTTTGTTILLARSDGQTGALRADSYYFIERSENGVWQEVEELSSEETYDRADFYHALNLYEFTRIREDWSSRFGELPAGQYRIGKEVSDGLSAETYWAEFEIDEDTDSRSDFVPAADWGVEVSVSDVSPTGLTMIFTQSGGDITRSPDTGSYFIVERLDGGIWQEAEELPLPDGVDGRAWTDEAYPLKKDGVTELEQNWEDFYGELPRGSYRIGKILDVFSMGQIDRRIYWAYFEI